MLIETSWTSTHEISTYAFRVVPTESTGPTHIVLPKPQFDLWLAVRGYRASENQTESFERPKTLLTIIDIALKTSDDFVISMRPDDGGFRLLATADNGWQHEVAYDADEASLESALLLGIALPVPQATDLRAAHEWTTILTYEAKTMKISSSTMPAAWPEARKALGELTKKKLMPLWFPRTLCISLNS